MFFTKQHFTKFLTETEANTMAKLANQIIDQNGVVLYGNAYQDGKCNNFSTENKPGDTHVLIGIGLSEMGLFSSMGTIKKEKPTESELVEVMEQRSKILEREISTLRSKKNE